jgi:small-conductance mechanosensitive channel
VRVAARLPLASLEFALACWIDAPQLEYIIASDLRFAIEAAFRRYAIKIPFPQRNFAPVQWMAGARGERAAAASPASRIRQLMNCHRI